MIPLYAAVSTLGWEELIEARGSVDGIWPNR